LKTFFADGCIATVIASILATKLDFWSGRDAVWPLADTKK